MPEYRRTYVNGGTYFFTLVTYQRRKLFTSPQAIKLLEIATSKVMTYHPFTIDAYCILPDHIHYIWTLPENDHDYSMRMGQLKRYFSRMYSEQFNEETILNESRMKRGEVAIWQRRFWEHTIQDYDDLSRHIEYVHFNPVKHDLVTSVRDWSHSSFYQFVEKGFYDVHWGESNKLEFKSMDFGE